MKHGGYCEEYTAEFSEMMQPVRIMIDDNGMFVGASDGFFLFDTRRQQKDLGSPSDGDLRLDDGFDHAVTIVFDQIECHLRFFQTE